MDNETVGMSSVNVDGTALFETVFKTHFKNLHTYAFSILRDDAAAEEVVQQIFYKLWEKREQIQIQHSLTSYLYRAVYNESLNCLRHAKVRATHRAATLRGNTDEATTGDPAAIKELQRKIEIAMNELPEQCRTIFQLSRFEDLKYKSIAAQLGISVKTVENQMGKALRLLRSKLSEFLPIVAAVIINMKK